jgi:DNA helicase HerA-like ATPase
MSQPMIVARQGSTDVVFLPALANRHGCITGATGTGKTVTLQVLAEAFSRLGTPVFMSDVKGDLTGLCQAGVANPKLAQRLHDLDLPEPHWAGAPVELWDVFGISGQPVRATVTDVGPVLLARMLELNDVQEGVLALVFRVADDEGQLLLDLKDLRAMLQDVAERAASLRTRYGSVSASSVGAIQRGLLALETQGAAQFFGEPMLDVADLIRCDAHGQGIVNILAADKLLAAPRLYAMVLLWLLAELYEKLPEVGDLAVPKLVFFFDEAHMLFIGAPTALLAKIEQVVRLVRSKGVGVYFVTQNPLDIPETVLGQLGNRVQHALRAFTPRDQKAVKAAAQTMRPSPGLDIEAAITELAVGEALVSFLDEKGRPSPTARAWIVPPGSLIGPAAPQALQALRNASAMARKYESGVDRESAYEVLAARAAGDSSPGESRGISVGGAPEGAAGAPAQIPAQGGGLLGSINDALFGSTGPRGGQRDGVVQIAARGAVRTIARELTRGLLGSLLGSKRR